MSKRNVKISKSNGTMWKCKVTDSYGNTHTNYWETAEQASKWADYVWRVEEMVEDKDKLMAKAVKDCIQMDKEAGITSENNDCLD